MAAERLIDITSDINADGRAIVECGGWDNAEVQLVTPTSTATFATSNDAGAITGVSDGSSASATNFITLQGTKVDDSSTVSTLAASGIVKFTNIGQFLRVIGPGLTVTKGIVRLYKIN